MRSSSYKLEGRWYDDEIGAFN